MALLPLKNGEYHGSCGLDLPADRFTHSKRPHPLQNVKLTRNNVGMMLESREVGIGCANSIHTKLDESSACLTLAQVTSLAFFGCDHPF